ncbi:MAG: hypothetical protein Q8N01_06885 [Sulfuricurvum sp.]|jgi:hypothetical protein|nr:hypothetical protein [Sulfuricurvum sp.]MDP3021746.1 hypothetical protein [Sulfuricurvum sp.]MDP3120122.1 hypothetical protein [Sulfuricurvum sp.]
MELKDVILSTLAELDDVIVQDSSPKHQEIPVEAEKIVAIKPVEEETTPSFASVLSQEMPSAGSDDEVRMLEGIRERLLVLFEGFQSPNNVNIEAKVDLTLNFFEYLLATIDNRLDTIR